MGVRGWSTGWGEEGRQAHAGGRGVGPPRQAAGQARVPMHPPPNIAPLNAPPFTRTRGCASTSSSCATTEGSSCPRPTISSTAAMQRTWCHKKAVPLRQQGRAGQCRAGARAGQRAVESRMTRRRCLSASLTAGSQERVG